MANNLNQPAILANTFCNNGDKTGTIPVTATGTNACSLEEGFPVVTSTAISEGGIPPKRLDFNGVFNLLSQYCLFLQNGGKFSYNSSVSTAIGGYPKGARLLYIDNNNVKFYIDSLIDNNTNAPSNSNIYTIKHTEELEAIVNSLPEANATWADKKVGYNGKIYKCYHGTLNEQIVYGWSGQTVTVGSLSRTLPAPIDASEDITYIVSGNYYIYSNSTFTLLTSSNYKWINNNLYHNSLPSNNYIDLTLGATETDYNAPADGWFSISKVTGTSSFNYLTITVKNEENNILYGTHASSFGNNVDHLALLVPVKKGNKITIGYSLSGSTDFFRFIYAQKGE